MDTIKQFYKNPGVRTVAKIFGYGIGCAFVGGLAGYAIGGQLPDIPAEGPYVLGMMSGAFNMRYGAALASPH